MFLFLTLFTVAAAAPADAEQSKREVVVYDQGLTIGQPHHPVSVKLNGRIQGRYTATNRNDGSALESEFSFRRVRASAAGHVGTPRLTYKVQVAFEDGVELADAMSDIHIAPERLSVRFGRFKRGTYRHHLTSSGKLALVDRAITHRAFDGGRDFGVAAHNGVTGSQSVTWMLGAFRDTSNRTPLAERATSEPTEVTGFEPALTARIGWNYGAVSGFDEIDWEDGGFRAGLGLSAFESIDANRDGDGRLRAAFDWAVQYEYINVTGDVHVAMQQPGEGAEYDGWGFQQQVTAVFFGRLSPALRFAVVDPVGRHEMTELTFALGYYFLRHRLKLQTDTSWLRHGAIGSNELLGRAQVQVIF